MKPLVKDARQKSFGDKFQLSFDGVEYLPTDNPTSLGVLLFGLHPQDIKVDCTRSSDVFMWLVQQAAHILQNSAIGKTHADDGSENLPKADLLRWISDATSLAPTPKTALAAHNMIVESLGSSCSHLRRRCHR